MTVWIQNPFDNLPCEGFRKQRFWLMAEAFAAQGHDVVLWTSDFSHANKAPRRFLEDPGIAAAGFTLRLIPTPPYSGNVGLARVRSHAAYARRWFCRAREEGARRRPDVIVTSSPTLSAALAALKLGSLFGAKVVVDVMDAWPETFERLAPKGLRWLSRLCMLPFRILAHRLYRRADLVTGVCERYRALTGRDDYCLAYHGVELPPSGPAAVRPETTARAVRLAYVGNTGRTYDLATVFRAVAANPDWTLDIAGEWKGPVPDRVRIHGYLDEPSLRQLLAACDVGVIPMRPDSWVGVPYKLCDYARAGLRIVSSLGGESSALLASYRCGETYEPGNPASLAEAVRRALTLERAAARRLCERAFDARDIYASYVARVCRLQRPLHA